MTSEEAIRNGRDILLEKDFKKHRKIQKKVVETRRPILVEEEVRNKVDGEKRFFISRKYPMIDEKNEVMGIMRFSIDVTEVRKTKATQFYKKRCEKLERQQISQEEFLCGYFLGGFENPLASMVIHHNYLYKMEKNPISKILIDQSLNALCKIYDHYTQIYYLLYDRKNFLSSFYEAIDLQEISDDLIKISKICAEQKGIHLVGEYQGDCTALLGDYQRIYCILSNLLNNAIQFTDQGGVAVSIVTEAPHEKDFKKAVVTLSVKDTGRGMKKHKLYASSRSFKKEVPESEQRGFALGLSMVKKAIHDLGGSIKIKSEEGQGSEFVVTLPLELAKEGL